MSCKVYEVFVIQNQNKRSKDLNWWDDYQEDRQMNAELTAHNVENLRKNYTDYNWRVLHRKSITTEVDLEEMD